jgi:hypothetical protein
MAVTRHVRHASKRSASSVSASSCPGARGLAVHRYRGLAVDRYPLPNLLAGSVVIRGLHGDDATASTRADPQAKSLGEFRWGKVLDIPEDLLGQE